MVLQVDYRFGKGEKKNAAASRRKSLPFKDAEDRT
jgi:cbb3-type cytochrome oxidase subunit 3